MSPRFKQFDHLDASESVWFNRQLEEIKAKTYDVEYPDLLARQLIPVATDDDPTDNVLTWRAFDMVGVAKFLSSYADDLPRADVFGQEVSSFIRPIGDSYGYNVFEIRKASREGVDLATKKSNAAKRGIEEKIDIVSLQGDSTYNLLGLYNQPNVTSYVIPNGAASATTWASKTPNEILTDMFGIVDSVIATTRGRFKPNTLLMPQTQFSQISRTRIDNTQQTTILAFFLATSPYIKSIMVQDDLKTAGASSVARIIAYQKDPDVLEMHVPQEFEQFDGQSRNLEVVVPCHARVGGVTVYRPLGVIYGDGV